MKKRIDSILLVIFLCFGMAVTVLADDSEGFSSQYYRVVDAAGLLSESERSELIAKLDEISLRQKLDVIVATTDSLEGFSLADYADSIYYSCDFGYGSEDDGVMLLINIDDRDWYIYTYGYGITAFTDAGIEYIGDNIRPYLSDGDFYEAFSEYAKLCDEFTAQARSGEPYDRKNLPREPLSSVWIIISVIIGFVAAKLVVGGMKGQLKSVRAQTTANSYVKSDSMNISESRDLFLYHTVTKTQKTTQGSSGSGSTTRTSASGRTHGGGGGKF